MSQNKEGTRNYGTNLCGTRIKQGRKEKGINQQELIAALEVDRGIKLHRSALVLIEQQKRSVSDIELVAFAKLLDVSVLWLLFGENQKLV
ncbi:MAG: transcriptional regulator with XRE-family HTH domain [bacterium]|jgi:transcriptional regulator with XRE-family HTH domain